VGARLSGSGRRRGRKTLGHRLHARAVLAEVVVPSSERERKWMTGCAGSKTKTTSSRKPSKVVKMVVIDCPSAASMRASPKLASVARSRAMPCATSPL